MNCTNCGTAIAEGAKFCGNCGKPLTASAGKKRRWPFWLKWILITPTVLFAALMALGYWANLRQQDRDAAESAPAVANGPNDPIDTAQVDSDNDLSMPLRVSYYLSQFARGTKTDSGLLPSAKASGGSGVPITGGPGLHKP